MLEINNESLFPLFLNFGAWHVYRWEDKSEGGSSAGESGTQQAWFGCRVRSGLNSIQEAGFPPLDCMFFVVHLVLTLHLTLPIFLPACLFPSPQSLSEIETTWHLTGDESHSERTQICQVIHCCCPFLSRRCGCLTLIRSA